MFEQRTKRTHGGLCRNLEVRSPVDTPGRIVIQFKGELHIPSDIARRFQRRVDALMQGSRPDMSCDDWIREVADLIARRDCHEASEDIAFREVPRSAA